MSDDDGPEVHVASVEEVERILEDLLARLTDLDEGTRALLPAKRTVEARCTDLEVVRYARWHAGNLTPLADAPDRRADIRIALDSETLVALYERRLTFSRAYVDNRIRLDASMTDLLRLRALL